MKKRIKIAIAEDHLVVRQGYVSMFNGTKIEVLYHVANGKELLDRVKQKEPDVVLLDIQMPVMDGIEALEILKEKHPKVKVVMLTGFQERSFVLESLIRGASAYLKKESGIEDLVRIISYVHENGQYYDQEILQMIETIADVTKDGKKKLPVHLSKREKQTLKLLCENNSNKDIATKLDIKIKTVEWHKYNMMKKIGSKNLASLILFAYQTKLN